MAIDLASMLFGGGPNGAQAQDPNKAAMSALAAQLLMGSGPQQQRTTFGQHIGAGLQAGMTAKNDALQQQTRDQFMQAQIQAMLSKQQERQAGIGAVNPGQYTPESLRKFQQTQDYGDLVPVQNTGQAPAGIQEFEYFNRLTPEQQKQFLSLQRSPVVPQLSIVNGVPTLVDRTNGNLNPLSNQQSENDAAAAAAAAKARGTAEGEAWGAMAKKGINALNVIETVQLAEPLIDVATGSGGGAAADKIAAFFGESLEGDKAIAQLKIIQANLMTNMPRMEGPQSDRDVELYREAAGQLGDATVPRGRKKAALKMILAMQEKYADMAPTAPGSAPAKPAVRRFNPQTGKIE
jgi:hypothetical protein